MLSAGSVTVPAAIVPGSTVTVEVYDPDVNVNPTLRESASVTVSVSCEALVGGCPADASARPAQAPEVVNLVETGPDTSIFTGTLATHLQVGSLAPHSGAGDGAVDIRGASSSCGASKIRFAYTDAVPSGVREATSVASFAGTATLSPSAIDPSGGGTLDITVVDMDLFNVSSIVVTVSSTRADEPSEQVTLTAASLCASPPTFTGSLGTITPGGAVLEGDGSMIVAAGDLLTLTYVDVAPSSLIRDYARVAADGSIALGPVYSLRSAMGAGYTQATVLPGGPLSITVADSDSDVDPGAAETVQVTVSVAGDEEAVSLVETGGSTGVFTGVLSTTANASAVAGMLDNAVEGAVITANFTDYDSSGAYVRREVTGRMASRGAVSMAASTQAFAAGDTVSVTVVDVDLDEDIAVAETVDVYLTVGDTGDGEVVSLTENAVSSGVFTGEIVSTVDPLDHEGKLLTTTPTGSTGSVVEASYNDVAPPGGRVSRLGMCSTGTVDAGNAYFRADVDMIVVTVTDRDLNLDPTEKEVANVLVTSSIEAENLVLTETEISSGVFTGSLPTTVGATAPADGNLTVAEVLDGVVVKFSDACPVGDRTQTVTSALQVRHAPRHVFLLQFW